MELSEIVPEYHSKNPWLRKLFLKRLETAIQLADFKINSRQKVIDLGCGEGLFLKLLQERFIRLNIFGIDSEPNIKNIKKNICADVRVRDLRNSGFPSNFFDIAFCLDVLEHFADLEAPVNEIIRILKPDGLLIVSLPTENIFYKIGRLITKGTVSEQKGPCSSPHFYNAKKVNDFLCHNRFKAISQIFLPSKFLPLFEVSSFKLIYSSPVK